MKRVFVKHLATSLAAISAATTLLTALFKLDCIKDCWIYGFIGALIVITGSVVYALWQIHSKKKIELNLSSELKLTVKEGDIFEQKGVICIPFNEYFDTHVGDGVVGKETLHGIFINKFFGDRVDDLDRRIRESLPNEGFEEHQRRIAGCPTRKYPLGTCISLREGVNTYVLFALTHFSDTDKADVSRSEITEVIGNLTKYLSDTVEEKEVFMPLFGTGLSRVNRTPQRILIHIVDALDFDDTITIPGGINILIKSLDKMNVNLNTVEYIVKQGIIEKEQ